MNEVCEWVSVKGREGWSDCIERRGGFTHWHRRRVSLLILPLSLSYNLNITVRCFSVFLLYILERYWIMISWERQYVCYTAVFVCVCCSWRANWLEQHFYSVTELKWAKCVLVPDNQSPGLAVMMSDIKYMLFMSHECISPSTVSIWKMIMSMSVLPTECFVLKSPCS